MRALHRLLLTAAFVSPAGVAAQAPGELPLVLQLPASTRAMALGDAYMMNARHADALFYHPALLTGAAGAGLAVQRWGPGNGTVAASAASDWLGGGVGIGLLALQYGAAPGVGSEPPGGQDHLFESGDVAVSERVAVVGFAHEVAGIDVGVAGKLVDERVGAAHDTELTVDLGLSTDVGPLIVALTARDWGREPLTEEGGVGPSRLVLGAGAYGQPLGIFDVGLTGALSWSDDRTVMSGGVEVGYWPISGRTFVGRVGVQQVPEGEGGPFSFGFAFWGDDVVFEWAYRPFGGLDDGTHRFGVGWR